MFNDDAFMQQKLSFREMPIQDFNQEMSVVSEVSDRISLVRHFGFDYFDESQFVCMIP